LVQNELFVIGINVNGINIIKDCLDGLDRMKVNWATGLLVLPYGELVEYIHLGYASIYEHYKLIEIERGNFVGEYYLNGNQYEKYRTADIELWKKTEEYAEISKKYDFETEPTKEYEEILFELIEVSIPDEIVDYLIRKYDILKEMKSVFVQIVPEDIEKVPNNNKYYIFIICGMLGIIIGLYIIIKNINIRKTI
ncbi:MAG: hypothetical protein LBQ93_09910, partial [Treponema sp.]|nr:hypothetical protein [Treponema sp.]